MIFTHVKFNMENKLTFQSKFYREIRHTKNQQNASVFENSNFECMDIAAAC